MASASFPTSTILLSSLSIFLLLTSTAFADEVRGGTGCSQEDQKQALTVLLTSSTLEGQLKFKEAMELLRNSGYAENFNCPISAAIETQKAAIEFRSGHTSEAIVIAERVIQLPNAEQVLSAKKLSLLHYVLGGSYTAERKFEKAEEHYLASVKLTSGDATQRTRLATVYADLSILYLQWGRLKDAERSIQKSSELEKLALSRNKYTQVLRLDTFAHMQMEKGRVSDAVNGVRALIDEFGSDKEVAADVRAHLYRDYGELCFHLKRLEESTDSLRKCMELERELRDTPATSLTLATLAQVQTQQKRFDSAELTLQAAQRQILPFTNDYPMNAAQVAIAAANCWQMRQRWAEARTEFLRSIEILRSIRSSAELMQRCLLSAAAVDHRLGKRQEEKQLRKEAKILLASAVIQPQPATTVDVTALRSSNLR